MADFVTPSFLDDTDVDTIHKRMLEQLPEDIDSSEGNHVWNLTRPTALEVAKMCEFILPEVIRLIFPEWSYGEYLDRHATQRALRRKQATNASGTLTITGNPGTEIAAGSRFATASVDDQPSVEYETMESAIIPDEGSVEVEAQCTQSGVIGNTKAGTIVLKVSNITGIKSIINTEDFTGGTEEEDDDSLKIRIAEYDKSTGHSYVGNKSDYKRWAKSVDGIGDAVVIAPEDKSGRVTIILTDLNGDPASQNLCESVYNYIMRPDDEYERLAPPNAVLVCLPPETIEISVSATVELEADYTIESVKQAFTAALALYMSTAAEEKEVKRTRIGSVLSSVTGVNDYKDLLLNGGTENIPIEINQLAVVSDTNLVLTEGEVV